MKRTVATILAAALFAAAAAQADERDGSLFDNVVRVLQARYFDEAFRTNELPALVERLRERAEKAETLREQREVTQALLSQLPATHMGLLSVRGRDRMLGELRNELQPTLGFELVEYDQKQYVRDVLEGGPADRAGLRRGDRVLLIDNVSVDQSPRLDWRTDDAYLPDPPLRALFCEEDEIVRFRIDRDWGKIQDIEIKARPYSAYEAAKFSARVIEHEGVRIGHVHFWFIHFRGVASLLKEKLEGEFADCDVLVLDLRGRGGSGGAIAPMLSVLAGRTSTWDKPIVALINQHSRSAKDVIAYELRKQKLALLVGETTAGAVIPASFEDVGHDTVLMFPTRKFGKYTDKLEGVGVEPHVVVREAAPHIGADLLLRAGLREAVKLAKSQPRTKSSLGESAAGRISKSGASDKTPSAEEIIKRSIKALGGRDAILRHSAQTRTGTFEVLGMISGKLSTVAAAPNRFASRIEFEGFGTLQSGCDGKVGWRIHPQRGALLLEGPELSDMLNQADFYAPLHYFKRYNSIETVGRTRFGGKECYRLEAVDTTGVERSLFFDAKTFLPMGVRFVRELRMAGEATVTVINEEFKKFDGVMIATRTRQTIGDIQEVVSTITDVSFEPIEKGAFNLPESIQELLKSG